MTEPIESSVTPIPGLQLAPDLSEAERIADLHARAIIIDGHNDALMPMADGKTNLLHRAEVPSSRDWKAPEGMPRDAVDDLYNFSAHTTWFQTIGFYDIPRALEGGVTSQAFSVYLADRDLDHALHRTMDMIASLYRMADESPVFELITEPRDFQRVKSAGMTSGFLTFEGLEPLGHSLAHLRLFHELGLRMTTLTHSRRTALADGSGQPGDPFGGGLTQTGRDAVAALNRLGIVIDLAHMNLRGAWEICERSEVPIVISHALPEIVSRASSGHAWEAGLKSRLELWERIANGRGLIGAIGWSRASLGEFVDGIDRIVQLVGIDHVALGTDFFGMDHAPVDFCGMDQMPKLTIELVRRGYDDEAVLKILGDNWLRVFSEVWS